MANILKIQEECKELLNANWTLPSNLKHGVLTTNYAFTQAKNLDKKPVEIAEEIVEDLNQKVADKKLGLIFKNIGPYINVDVEERELLEVLNKEDINLVKKPENFFLEYVSPNVAKPLHVGHLRNINIGESLFRLLSLKYENVITDNHWGDWGVQFGILIWAKKNLKGDEIVIINDKEECVVNTKDDDIKRFVKMYVWANQQQEYVDNWEGKVRDEFLKLEQGDKENQEIWQEIVDKSKVEIGKQMEQLGVTPHQLNLGESFYEDEIKKLSEVLEKENIWEKDGEARYFDFKKVATQVDKMGLSGEKTQEWFKALIQDDAGDKSLGRGYLISSKGYSTYLFRDIAARFVWLRDYDANIMLTLVDHTQNHHLRQVFALTFYLANLPVFQNQFKGQVKANNLQNIGYGFIKLPEGKMSTRKGNFFTANDLVEIVKEKVRERMVGSELSEDDVRKIAIAAIRWADLSKDWKNDVVLNVDEILKFEGNTGVYELYTVVRLNSILEKNKDFLKSNDKENGGLLSEEELGVLKQVLTFEIVLENAINELKPHILANYIYELSSKINSWYGKTNITRESDLNRKEALLKFVKFLRNHLKFCLDLLVIETVEKL